MDKCPTCGKPIDPKCPGRAVKSVKQNVPYVAYVVTNSGRAVLVPVWVN